MKTDMNFNLWGGIIIEFIFNAISILLTAYFVSQITCCRDNRGEANIGELVELAVTVGNTIYKVRGHFKSAGGTASDKFLRIMEKSLAKDEVSCYNGIKSQKGLDCKHSAASGTGKKGA